MRLVRLLRAILPRDSQSDRIVPPSGFTANLTLFASGAMAFLAVFALTLSFAAGQLASRWGAELAKGATVRIIAPEDQIDAQVQATLRVLETTPGVALARHLSKEEHQALLAPWFGDGIDVSDLPVPELIEVIEADPGIDATGLRLRLAGEAPGATFDDHARWRAPLLKAAARLRGFGWLSILLIGGTMAAIITLAANAALAANAQIISVLRLVGATDGYIANAFVRRFTMRAGVGAAIGTVIGFVAVMLLPGSSESSDLLIGIRVQGWQVLVLFLVPPIAALVAFFATRFSARKVLEGLT